MEISVFIQNTHISNFKLRYLFNADISILRRDISSALIEISAFEIQISALKYNYSSNSNLDIFILALLYILASTESQFCL